ncbi:MAG: hypothetical protein WKF77_09830 [Planctomycetaceae bacterium]
MHPPSTRHWQGSKGQASGRFVSYQGLTHTPCRRTRAAIKLKPAADKTAHQGFIAGDWRDKYLSTATHGNTPLIETQKDGETKIGAENGGKKNATKA